MSGRDANQPDGYQPYVGRWPERDANQLAADVRAAVLSDTTTTTADVSGALAALDELVALVGTLQQERDEARSDLVYQTRESQSREQRRLAAEAALAEARQALADSLRDRPEETEARDTYADGYTSGLIRALQIVADTGGDTAPLDPDDVTEEEMERALAEEREWAGGDTT